MDKAIREERFVAPSVYRAICEAAYDVMKKTMEQLEDEEARKDQLMYVYDLIVFFHDFSFVQSMI